MKKICLLAMLTLCYNCVTFAKNTTNESIENNPSQQTKEEQLQAEEESKIFSEFKGKPVAVVFANYNQGFGDLNDISGINIDRAILGYNATFGKGLSAKLEVDFAATTTNHEGDKIYASYVRNAELIWEVNDLKLSFGVTTPKLFNFLENYWGHRFMVKSPMDEYKYGSSRDLGVVADYKFNDWLTLDFSLLNGNGYKDIVVDNNHKYGVGLTILPTESLTVRLYGESFDKDDTGEKGEYIAVGFIGYKVSKLTLGFEYDYKWNTGFVDGNDGSIISCFATYDTGKKSNVFARYDNSRSVDNWNGDDKAIYLGYEYQPIKYVKLGALTSIQKEIRQNWSPLLGVYLELKY